MEAAHLQQPPGHLGPTLTVFHSFFGMAIKEEVQGQLLLQELALQLLHLAGGNQPEAAKAVEAG